MHIAWQNKLAIKNPHDLSSDFEEKELGIPFE
jgi:hypothetical protein